MIDLHDLQAKSDQMNAIDFVKPMTFRIEQVEYQPKQEQPIRLHFEGYKGRPYKPCKGMLRGLAQVWGMDETQWNGKLIELYCDPSVKWAGKDAGGIRINAVSGITQPFELVVRINRSQREVKTWGVIPDDAAITREFVATHFIQDIEEAESNETINIIVQEVKKEFGKDALSQIKDAVVTARAKFVEPETVVPETTEATSEGSKE